MFFQRRSSHSGPLFKDTKIVKSFDKAALKAVFLLVNLERVYCHLALIVGSNFL